MTLSPPLRCVYFVPGNQPERLRAVPEYRPDGVVIDLESSVPPAEVPAALDALADHVEALRAAGQHMIMVRSRELKDGGLGDVEAAGALSVDAVVVPKATPDVVEKADARLAESDTPTALVPILETPDAISDSLRVLRSGQRVAGVIGGSGTRNGDLHRTLGFEWTEAGEESLYVRSQVLLHARAAGLEHIIGCAWAKVADREGLRRHARGYRALGYTGYVAVDASQIATVHEVFTPSREEINYASRVLEAMAKAEKQGSGLVLVDGELQARCAIEHAERVLKLASAVPELEGTGARA